MSWDLRSPQSSEQLQRVEMLFQTPRFELEASNHLAPINIVQRSWWNQLKLHIDNTTNINHLN